MAITVFSQTFKRELDIEQILSLRGHDCRLDINTRIKNLSNEEKGEIYNDVICPICRSQGGKIVLASTSKQAHFRFDTHNYFCDYNNSKDNKSQKGKLVDFGSDRSHETKIIRELVAKGIEQEIISQHLISEMRKYFYDTKIDNQYKMDVSVDAFKWWMKLTFLQPLSLTTIHHIKFNPIYAQLPNFNWKLAAESLFIQENINLIEIANNCDWRITQKIYDKTIRTIQDTQSSIVFYVTKLHIPYQNTITLAHFIANNLFIKDSKKGNYLISSDIVLALAALLLYIADWDIEAAILKLIKIVESPAPNDINSGNVIGLNPFYDFEVWAIIAKVREVSNYSTNGFDYKAHIEAIETRLKSEYELWKSLHK
ncbi:MULTISPECIES: hypothetical protein [Nostoc]|uniref:Uncharacterized protein n=2 Tax=Nostoc TaxID=1177 RepID=A0ABR8IGN8_9NOSO|nr:MULTISPECIES: hypothetical protein [Nostoc]MBD2564311.1 hypothetical protein [Nostoc linckia FACHB-391]MBD2650761.1 hypothetical protein [Nostoc foliaceum FACHB-393]